MAINYRKNISNKKIPVGKRVSWHVQGKKSFDMTSGINLAYVPAGTDIMNIIPEVLTKGSSQRCFKDEASTKDRYLVVVERASYKSLDGDFNKYYYAPLASQLERAYWGINCKETESQEFGTSSRVTE